MFLSGENSAKQPNVDQVNTVRRSSMGLSPPGGSARRASMPTLTPIVTSSVSEVKLSPTATSAADHEAKHITNSQVQPALLAISDEILLSLIYQRAQSRLRSSPCSMH